MVSDSTIEQLRTGNRKSMNLSFAGCGFLGIYHVGVCSCFRRYGSHLSNEKIAGASAGALAACALLTGVGLGESTNYVLDVALKARSRALGPLHPSFNICQYLTEGLERFLPDDAYKTCTGRLFISLTRVSDRKNVLISEFDSNADLIQALNCSAFIPFYSGIIPPKYKGVRYVDGGLSNNIPILDEQTVTVSPFAGESDICPNDNSSSFFQVHLANTSIQVNACNIYRFSHALFPPKPEQLSAMCQNGFNDALRFLQENGLISCARHLRIESAITPMSGTRGLQEQAMYVGPTNEPSDTSSEEDDYYNYDKLDMSFDEDVEDYEFDEEEEEEDVDYVDSCEECKRHRKTALTESLPHPVVSALQTAIDNMNMGILTPIYNLRAYKVISLLAAPWFLPVDVTVVLARKFYDWAPYLPSDMQWFVHEFRHILGDLYDAIQSGRHRFSARFSCQLAITETDMSRDPTSNSPLFRRRHSTAIPSRRPDNLLSHRKNLNVGFSVDFHTHQKSPLKCMDDLRQQILDDEHHHHGHHVRLTQVSTHETEETATPAGRRKSYTVISHNQPENPVAYDTFDNCLHITKQMEAILAYHYTEENKPNTIKVAEIYALDDPRGPRPDFNTADLAWDSYTELKPENSPDLHRSKTTIFNPATAGRLSHLPMSDWE